MASGPDKKIQYYVRPPDKTHKAFAIIQRIRSKGTPTKNVTIKSPVVQAINKQWKSGALKIDEVREALDRELARLRKLGAGGRSTVLAPANLRLLKKYWQAVYEDRDIIDHNSAWNRLRRAVDALGDTSLTASKNDIQKAINRVVKGNKQRDVASALNQILRWLGRPDKLDRAKRERRRVRFLTLAEWSVVALFLPEPIYRTLGWVAITTGCRTGEIFGLSTASYRAGDGTLFIDLQQDKKFSLRQTKNRRDRDVPILPDGVPYVVDWLALAPSDKGDIRHARLADIIGRACKRAFPQDKSKWLTFHDLRHSYSVHLLNKGVSIGLLAQCLGDSEAVVREHYAGFVLTKPGMEAIKAILS